MLLRLLKINSKHTLTSINNYQKIAKNIYRCYNRGNMLDKKSTAVLKALNKLAINSAYKVVTTDEIISNLTQKSQFDADSVNEIIAYLGKQEYINIKFSEENTYCYSLLPKARIFLEQESGKVKQKKSTLPFLNYIFVFVASFVGTMLALIIFFAIVL